MARGKHSKFTDKMGRFHTKALFVEQIQKEQLDNGIVPIYTLKGDPAYIDAHQMFIDSNDPTGYTFAIEAFDSWAHLQHLLKNCKWFREIWAEWQDELEVKLRSEAIKNLVYQSKDSKGTTAAKYLADKGWEPKKRGRPSKDEVEAERKQQAAMRQELDDDLDRIGELH